MFIIDHAGGRIAQSVEQGTENPRVPSSILGSATIFCTHARWISTGLFLPQAAGTPIHGMRPASPMVRRKVSAQRAPSGFEIASVLCFSQPRTKGGWHGTRRTGLLGRTTVRVLGQRLDDSRIQRTERTSLRKCMPRIARRCPPASFPAKRQFFRMFQVRRSDGLLLPLDDRDVCPVLKEFQVIPARLF